MALIDLYLGRFSKTGRPFGLGPAEVIEVSDRHGGGQSAEADLLAAAIPQGAARIALDETGAMMTSPDFARLLRGLADGGTRDLAVLIGGAVGLDAGLRATAARIISFGPMVWPHMLARVMIAEQLYRAATILAGHPYHRGG